MFFISLPLAMHFITSQNPHLLNHREDIFSVWAVHGTARTLAHSHSSTLSHILSGEVRLRAVWGSRSVFPHGWHPAHVNGPFLQKLLMQGPVLTVFWQWVSICQPWPLSDCRSLWKTDLWQEQRLIYQWGSAGDCLYSHVWLRIGWEELTPLPRGVLTEVCVCLCCCEYVCVCWWWQVKKGEMTRFEEEGLCSQSIIFRDDKGCFVPFQRCKTNTSRPYKYCG